MLVGLAAADGAFASGLAAMLDVLRTAEALRAQVDPAIGPIRWTIHASRARVETTAGMTLKADAALSELSAVDVAVVCGFGQTDPETLLDHLYAPQGQALINSLGALQGDKAVAAACTGSFVLAEAGLLEQRRATTSWWLSATFRARYPSCSLDMEAMVVRDGRVTTAGAALGHVDLALELVRRVSLDLAESVASFLLIDHRPAQSSYAALGHLCAQDELVAAFERYVRANLSSPASIDDIATEVGASRRTLERRVRATLGLSPLQVVQRLRAEHAAHLIATTDRSIDDVARTVGYLNGSTLRALLRHGPRRQSAAVQ